MDATEFEMPPGPLVVFFFNPFGELLMSHVLANIRRSLEQTPRPLIIVYNNPVHRRILDGTEFLTPIPCDDDVEDWATYRSRIGTEA